MRYKLPEYAPFLYENYLMLRRIIICERKKGQVYPQYTFFEVESKFVPLSLSNLHPFQITLKISSSLLIKRNKFLSFEMAGLWFEGL
jgi:hypothetical protein